MRILILLIAIFLSIGFVEAKKPPRQVDKPVMTSPTGSQVPIDDEFQTDFVGFDEKEFKQFQKEQKKQAKLDKKRKKLEEKRAKLELKRKNSLENRERCVQYIEKLRATEVDERINGENL